MNETFLEEAGYTLIKAIKKGFRGDAKELLKAVVRGNGCAEEWTPEMEDAEDEEDEEEEEEEEAPEVDDGASIQVTTSFHDHRYLKLQVLGQNEGRRYIRKCVHHV